MKTILAFLLAFPLAAQSFYGAFAFGQTSSRPQPSAGAFWAIQLNTQAWSFTEYQTALTGNPKVVSVNTRSGIATPCKDLGRLRVYCLGTVGVATAGQSVSASMSMGAIATYPIKKVFVFGGFEVPWIPNPVTGQKTTTREGIFGVAFK